MKGEHASENRTVIDDKQLLADCYLEYWLRQGVNCERYYLIKSRDHYKAALDSLDNKKEKDMNDRMRRSSVSVPSDFSHHIKYCRVLQYLGEFEAASKFLTDHVLRLSTDDPEYPNHLFCAGVIQKAMNNFEEANEKFFEASQIGPPRFFSKVGDI
jgi:tetratricopeptide (TPR) repeat protein